MTVKTSYHFKFLPLVGIAASAVGGLDRLDADGARRDPNVDTTGPRRTKLEIRTAPRWDASDAHVSAPASWATDERGRSW